MRYLSYLNHYDIRQCPAQYLSVLYEIRWNNLDTYFILNEDYLKPYKTGDRWEVNWALTRGKNPEVIKPLGKDRYYLMKKPENLVETRIPSQILYRTESALIPTQKETIEKALRDHKIDAGLTWVNNVGFKSILAVHDIPVIHHEMGPFRPTTYISTVYLDFNGVNGETEFEAIAIVGGHKGDIKGVTAPCGVCRQVLAEFCDKDFEIVLYNGSFYHYDTTFDDAGDTSVNIYKQIPQITGMILVVLGLFLANLKKENHKEEKPWEVFLEQFLAVTAFWIFSCLNTFYFQPL